MTKLKMLALCLILASPLAACSDDEGAGNENVTRNQAPLLESLSADRNELRPGESAVLTAVATDADEDALSFVWVLPENWTIEGEGAEVTVTAPDAYDAEAVIRLTVDDGKGGNARAEVTIRTGENSAPAINATEATPNPVAPAGTTVLSVDAADPDGDALSVEWSVSEGWTLGSTTGTTVDLVAPERENATALVGVTVDDGHGGEASAQFIVSTSSNAVPVISALTANPPQTTPGGTIALAVAASDADADTLTYTWTAPTGWALEGEGANVTVTAPDAYAQTATVGVVVADGQGAEASAEIVISTASNQGPIISSITANPANVARGGTIALAASASDPNGDTLSYTWSAPTDWTLTQNDNTATLVAPAQPGQTATVTLTIEDSTGAQAVGSVVVSTLPNNAPTISALTARPSLVAPGATIALSSTATDVDGDALSYAWSAPSGWSLSGSGADVALSAPTSYDQTAIIELVVTDALGASSRSHIIVATVANTAPVVSSLSANPTLVDIGETSTVEVIADDTHGDTLGYTWSASPGWSVAGTGPQVTVSAPMDKGASGTVTVVVDDGNGLSAQSHVVITTRDNRAPSIASLSASPDVLQPSGVSQVSVAANDPDGDALTYTWQLASAWTGSSTTDAIDVTAPDAFGASAVVTVRVSDGTSTVSESISLTTVANAAPVLHAVDAASLTPQVDTMTALTADASDADGHPLSYDWSVSNPNWKVFGAGASIQLHSPAQAGEDVTVTVRVEDNFGASVTGSVDLTSTPCGVGTDNCDVGGANGCEISTDDDVDHCGGCGIACAAAESCTAGVCEVLRTELMTCGTSQRDVAEFIPADSGLVKASGCLPNPATQALLVTRSGVGAIDATGLQDYVNAGGNVLTEFSASDEVFNAVFGTAVPQGTFNGGCRDRISTLHQYNAGDPFWQDNTFVAMSAQEAGCGQSLHLFPGITALAGWNATTVSLAYRDHGEGRVWLVEADWQDTEITGADFADTRALMQAMIAH